MLKRQVNELLYTNKSGFTLVGVLMVLVVLTVLGLSIMSATSNFMKISAGERNDQSTFYIAEAGVTTIRKNIDDKVEAAYKAAYEETEQEYERLRKEEKATFDFENVFKNKFLAKVLASISETTTTIHSFEDVLSETPEAIVSVSRLNANPPEYKIKSVGKIGNKKRTVSQKVSVVWSLEHKNTGGDTPTPPLSYPSGMGIFVKENITLNSAVITGNIGTLKSSSKSIVIGDGGVNIRSGSFYVPSGYEGNAVQKPSWMNGVPVAIGSEMGSFPVLPPFPTIPSGYDKIAGYTSSKTLGGDSKTTITLQNNASIGALTVNASHILTIDVGDTNKELVLDSLELSGNAQIIIKGNGSLKLYVKDSLKYGGSAKFNAQSPNKNVQIYYAGSDLKLNSDTRIYASLYAEKANIKIGGSDQIHGSIYSGGSSFIVEGGGNIQPSLYFAPNAHFDIRSSGKVTGVIIGKSINVSGMGEVHYLQPTNDNSLVDDGNNQTGGSNNSEGNDSSDTQSWGLVKGALIEE